MNKKAMKWLLSLLDDDDLNHLSNKASLVVPGYRPGQAPRGKRIQALTNSKAFAHIVKDLKRIFVGEEQDQDQSVLSEIEVTRLLQEADADIPALLYRLAFHTDSDYRALAEVVLEEANKRGPDEYATILRKKKEKLVLKDKIAKGVETLEAELKEALSKLSDQSVKLSNALEMIKKLKQLQKKEKSKVDLEKEKLKTDIGLLIKENEALIKAQTNGNGLVCPEGETILKDTNNKELRCSENLEKAIKDLTQDKERLRIDYEDMLVLSKREGEENEQLKEENTELTEMNKLLELDIRALEMKLITQSECQQVLTAVAPRLIIIGGKTAETLSRKSPEVRFLGEDEIANIEKGFFDKYDRVLLPLYNSTTMTQIKISQIVANKVIQFSNHLELVRYLKGVI